MYGFSLYFTEVVENLKLDYCFWDGGNTKVQRFKNLEHEDIILFFILYYFYLRLYQLHNLHICFLGFYEYIYIF